MTIRKILVPVLQGYAFSAQLSAALQLTRDLSQSINAVFIPSDLPHSGGPEATISISDLVADDDITFEDAAEDDSADEALARANFKVWRTAHNLASGHENKVAGVSCATWRKSHKSIENEIVASGRLSDLIILNRPNPHEAAKQKAFDAAVFGTGRPTLFVFNEVPDNILDHVLIAWNGSIDATRAVAAAMPLLERATRVSIFTAPGHDDSTRDCLDISELLICHDIQSHKLHDLPNERSVGAALLRAAAYQSATAIVMGAYSHSHLREVLLDGVTLHVVQHGTIPVLMTH